MSFLTLEKLERLMAKLVHEPQFLKDVLIISMNCTLNPTVRLVSAIAFESGIENHWSHLSDDDKDFVKTMLISNLRLDPDEELFDAYANATRKIAIADRYDELGGSLVDWLVNNGNDDHYEEIWMRPRALKILKLLVESDLTTCKWETFTRSLSETTLPALVDCLNDYNKMHVAKVMSNAEPAIDFDDLRNAIDCLKVLKKLVLGGNDQQACMFFKLTYESYLQLVESRDALKKRSEHQKLLELHDKNMIKHLAIFINYNNVTDEKTIFDSYLILLSRVLLMDQSLFDQIVVELQKNQNLSKILAMFLNSKPESKLLAMGLDCLLVVDNVVVQEQFDRIIAFNVDTLMHLKNDDATSSSLEASLKQLSLNDEVKDLCEFLKTQLEKLRACVGESKINEFRNKVESRTWKYLRDEYHIQF